MADPRTGTVSVELNTTAAQLLAGICAQLGEDNPTAVLSRALGLYEMTMRIRRQGGRLCFVNEHGELSDVIP
ncbi:MAG TPA: hypothetical protein VFG83_06885 [Kofleriaceae bacterium]|nr:hypothetical protein [Kofleriaceae bacterium]